MLNYFIKNITNVLVTANKLIQRTEYIFVNYVFDFLLVPIIWLKLNSIFWWQYFSIIGRVKYYNLHSVRGLRHQFNFFYLLFIQDNITIYVLL
jgi:hypothetical protein